MSEYLPRLRTTLDVTASPFPDQPGIVLRDPFGYSEDLLLIPESQLTILACLDGAHTELDLQTLLTRRQGGRLVAMDGVRGFVSLLDERGFLETDAFLRRRDEKHSAFETARERAPAHAGVAYPEQEEELRQTFDEQFRDDAKTEGSSLMGLAAPHVSPEGGWASYTAAYRQLDASLRDRTFVILGTSHYGEPERFGLTRKAFSTPLGIAETDEELVSALVQSAPESVMVEDYCHAVEHSIEFQVIFLQYRMRSPVRILPILCGPFVESLATGKPPESSEPVRRFFDALADLADRHRNKLFWLLGVDLAHIGVRYGDAVAVRAGEGRMAEVAEQDGERLERICAGEADAFFELVKPGADELKWCGFSPLYTFLASLRRLTEIRGRVLHYQQWNIDPQSVVTFAGLEFVEKNKNQTG
jgi:hypothetical protein